MILNFQKNLYNNSRKFFSSMSSSIKISSLYDSNFNKLEEIVQRDEGKRGIKELLLPHGELKNATEKILTSECVTILTGFPCLLDRDIKTETDGPLGALSLVKSCLKLGKQINLLTDECNEEVLLACSASSNLHNSIYGKELNIDENNTDNEIISNYTNLLDKLNLSTNLKKVLLLNHLVLLEKNYLFKLNVLTKNGTLALESFPSREDQKDEVDERLNNLKLNHFSEITDLIITIERAGCNKDGKYKTMRARDMTHLISSIDDLLQPYIPSEEEENNNKNINKFTSIDSIGIGDGGNEVGMGKIYDKILNSSINLKEEIACIQPTDYLLVSSVSNWGGYSLSAGFVAMYYINYFNKYLLFIEKLINEKYLLYINLLNKNIENENKDEINTNNEDVNLYIDSLYDFNSKAIELIQDNFDKINNNFNLYNHLLNSIEINQDYINNEEIDYSLINFDSNFTFSSDDINKLLKLNYSYSQIKEDELIIRLLFQIKNNIQEIIKKAIEESIPTDVEETQKLEGIIMAGAGDGVTGKNELMVDGMPLSESLRVLQEIRSAF